MDKLTTIGLDVANQVFKVHGIAGGESSFAGADGAVDGVGGAPGGLSQQVLELGEEQLDWIQVRRVFRQEEELGTGFPNGMPDGLALVRAELVDHDDVGRLEGGQEHLLDIERRRARR